MENYFPVKIFHNTGYKLEDFIAYTAVTSDKSKNKDSIV